jgi:hypothetical protein
MSIKVNLKPYYEWLKDVAKKREALKERTVKNRRILSDNKEIVGLMGEMAYSIVTGESVDTRLLLGGDGGVDFPGGVNVKATDHKEAKWLIVDLDKLHEADVYVMVLVDLGKMIGDIIGWIDLETFLEIGCEKDFGHGMRWGVMLTNLRKPMEFQKINYAVYQRYEQYSKLIKST